MKNYKNWRKKCGKMFHNNKMLGKEMNLKNIF